jgi:large subunit ribosomal protein L32e
MAEENKRNKPDFLRKDWHKKIKLGSTVKKKRKWRAAKGRQNKIRLGRKGHSTRPKIGWGAEASIKGKINQVNVIEVKNIKDLDKITQKDGALISRIGKKKRMEIIKKCNEMKIKILNKYRKIKNESN